MIPIASPQVGEDEIEAVAAVIRSGMLAQGDVTRQFEESFANYCECAQAIGTNNGTSALHAALLAAGIQPGDEVIVPDFTFIATATAVSMCGTVPVMVDVDQEYYTLKPSAVQEAITPKTKAIIGVHLFGQPFDLRSIQELCEDNNLLLIEDCAQAHGARYDGVPVGSFGIAGCFSFYPTKNMTTGEGGMITTQDKKLATRARQLINHGQSEKYLHTMLGYNYRMPNLMAAIGQVQLKKIDRMTKQRQENARYFSEHLDADLFMYPKIRPQCEHVFHQYVIRPGDGCSLSRDELMDYLRQNGIGSAVHYPIPVHKQPVYQQVHSSSEISCPVTEQLCKEVLSLPVHPGVGEEECRIICDVLNGVNKA